MLYFIEAFFTHIPADNNYYERFAYRLDKDPKLIGWCIAIYNPNAEKEFIFRNGRPKYSTGWVWL